MILIVFLFLCSRLVWSLTLESSQEIDCNDLDLFMALDAALKKYNERTQTDNQFVLQRITETTKTDDADPSYSFKYKIKEGNNCSVQSGKSWQDCDYKDSAAAATGECTATVGETKHQKFVVTNQTCHITPGESPVTTTQYRCRGCFSPMSTSHPSLEPVLRHALQHFNNHNKHSHLFTLREVNSARQQVVAGMNYDVVYSVGQTNCSKERFPALTPRCQLLLNGDFAECTDQTYVNISDSIAGFSQKCDIFQEEEVVKPPPNMCIGCPEEIPVDSPELKEALTHSIRHLNAQNNGTFYFRIDTVTKATKEVVAGMKYSLTFTARETVCSKGSNIELIETCGINKLGQVLTCEADIILSLEKNVLPAVNCQPLQMVSMMQRPPGFSPFRAAVMMETKQGKTVSPPHTPMTPAQDEGQDIDKEQGPTHGQDSGHKKKIKHDRGHGQKHRHDQSHDHIRGHGFGHGHQKHHDHGHGHGHQQEPDYNLQFQVRPGLGHGHQGGHALAHGHKHGHDHGKHKNKDKNSEKHNGWRTEHLASLSEDSTTASRHTPENSEGPTPTPSLAQQGVAVTYPGFLNSDLIATVMPNIPPTPTETDDVWIPNIQIEPNSLSFSLIPDFPETASPKCPGHTWKPVNKKDPTVEKEDFSDFDLSDALY